MKKRILVNLPDNLIDAETKKLIKNLKGQVYKLESKIYKLESELKNQTSDIEKARKLIEVVREAGKFCPEYCEGGRDL